MAFSRRRFLETSGAAAAGALLPLRAAEPGSAIRFGYAAITWDGDDRRAIREIAEVGFRGIQLRLSAVETWGDRPQELRDLLASHGLVLVALSSGEVSPDPARSDEEVRRHARNAAFVRDCGGLYLQLLDERPQGRPAVAEDYVRMGRLITEIGRRAADLGVAVGYHNHMGNLGERPEEVARILDAADPRYVKLQLDTAHYRQAGGDPARAVETYADRLLFLHVKDVESPVPGGAADSYRFVELGRGKVDFPALFAALRRVKFHGWAVVELDAVPDSSRTPKESAILSRRYLEEKLGFEVQRG